MESTGPVAAKPGPSLDPAAPATLLERISRQPTAILLGIAWTAFLLLEWASLREESSTYDECAHLPAGFTYVTARDFRLNPEHPPLLKLQCGLAARALGAKWPSDPGPWEDGDQWTFGFRFLYQSGNRPDRLLSFARVVSILWGLLLIGSVYAVSRDRWGPEGGLVSLVLGAACPTLLAHAHLVTTDVIAATLMFLSVVAHQRLLAAPRMSRALQLGVLLGGALLAKYSALVLLPILGGQALWVACRRRWKPALPEVPPQGRLRWTRAILLPVLAATTSLLTLWSAYRFRYEPSPDGSFSFPWAEVTGQGGLLEWALQVGRRFHLAPEAYLYGVAHVANHARKGHDAFAFGLHSTTGWIWYFPLAFLVKVPSASLILFAWGADRVLRSARTWMGPLVFWGAPPLIYGVIAIQSSINIGIRHLLPLFPFLFVVAGAAATLRMGARMRVIRERWVLALLGLVVLESAASAPDFISFFNLPSFALGPRHEMLVDSNLDWGQDLRRLKRYVDQHKITGLKLAYFGTASPRQLGLDHEVLPGFNLYSRLESDWPRSPRPEPGDTVAISATNLVGTYLADKGLYRRWTQSWVLSGKVGHSILIYRVPVDQP